MNLPGEHDSGSTGTLEVDVPAHPAVPAERSDQHADTVRTWTAVREHLRHHAPELRTSLERQGTALRANVQFLGEDPRPLNLVGFTHQGRRLLFATHAQTAPRLYQVLDWDGVLRAVQITPQRPVEQAGLDDDTMTRHGLRDALTRPPAAAPAPQVFPFWARALLVLVLGLSLIALNVPGLYAPGLLVVIVLALQCRLIFSPHEEHLATAGIGALSGAAASDSLLTLHQMPVVLPGSFPMLFACLMVGINPFMVLLTRTLKASAPRQTGTMPQTGPDLSASSPAILSARPVTGPSPSDLGSELAQAVTEVRELIGRMQPYAALTSTRQGLTADLDDLLTQRAALPAQTHDFDRLLAQWLETASQSAKQQLEQALRDEQQRLLDRLDDRATERRTPRDF